MSGYGDRYSGISPKVLAYLRTNGRSAAQGSGQEFEAIRPQKQVQQKTAKREVNNKVKKEAVKRVGCYGIRARMKEEKQEGEEEDEPKPPTRKEIIEDLRNMVKREEERIIKEEDFG